MLYAGVLTISDKGSCGQREDLSGPAARSFLTEQLSIEVSKYEIIPDERDIISARLREWADEGGLDLIVTSGGTGLSPRDVTPEATRDVIERIVPGIAETMRSTTSRKAPTSILSRAVAGSRGKCLIINLPGSPKGVQECLEAIGMVIPHALEILSGAAIEGPHYKGG
jgi:molybdenum cofactor synthesis domain-containing protein